MSRAVRITHADVTSHLTLLLLICLAVGGHAQSTGNQSKTKAQLPPVKLTLQQERGFRLLKIAEAESAGLPPTMQAFVLWRVSYAYTKIDPRHAEKLSRSAFMATQGIEDAPDSDRCAARGSAGDMKSWIQQRVLYDMIHKDQQIQVERLLPQATASVRNEITAELVSYYVSKKNLTHAESLLSTLADSD